jgi:hypothetical protein
MPIVHLNHFNRKCKFPFFYFLMNNHAALFSQSISFSQMEKILNYFLQGLNVCTPKNMNIQKRGYKYTYRHEYMDRSMDI